MTTLRIPQPYQVSQIIDHTANVRELKLTATGVTAIAFKAGQFFMLHVPQENAKPALRAYSVASSDSDPRNLKLLFKYIDQGVASKFVWALTGGETLQFTGGFGKVFFKEPPTEQIVFLNTGTGISQHLCYLLSKKNSFPNLHYKLFFGVRNQKDIYLENELSELKKELPNFEYSYVLSRPDAGWAGKTGYVQDFLKDINYSDIPTTFYLCGNGGMIKAVKNKLLVEDKIPADRVWSEAFD